MPLGQRAIAWSREALARRGTSSVRAVIAGVMVVALVAAIGSASSSPQPTALPGAGSGAVARVSPSASPTPMAPSLAVSASALPSASASASPSPLDADDGETAPASGPLPTPLASVNPHAAAVGWLAGEPDAALTPGALNPAVTQATIGSTICVSGWTATIRPSSSYTTGLKIEQIGEYGYTDTSTASYEEDHLISLELGGAPSDPRNLWPEPYSDSLPDGRDTGARVKDVFESSLKREVCAGQMTLAKAQSEIGDHWVHFFYGIPLSVTAWTAPTPAPAASKTPAPSNAPSAAPGTLTVRITGVKSPVVRGTSASASAATAAGSACSIKVTLPSGRVSTVAALLQAHTASSTGAVNWTWTVTSNTGTGTAHVTIACSLGGKTGSASTTFNITS